MSKLIAIRGNSGSGKTTLSKELLKLIPGSVLVEQDYFIKYVISPKTAEQEAIRRTRIFTAVKDALSENETVILEGVFDSRRYTGYFEELIQYHPVDNFFYYIDLAFEETLKRHSTREKRYEFGESAMKDWYIEHDQFGYDFEETIAAEEGVDEAVRRIIKLIEE